MEFSIPFSFGPYRDGCARELKKCHNTNSKKGLEFSIFGPKSRTKTRICWNSEFRVVIASSLINTSVSKQIIASLRCRGRSGAIADPKEAKRRPSKVKPWSQVPLVSILPLPILQYEG
jgi:hypothetical protein